MSNLHTGNGAFENQARDDGILHVTIHQAKHIHNICIYGNQDVYAKFLFTHLQDAVYPTQPVKAGGQNPVFNQSLQIPVSACDDTVLKCELWMMSCARNYLEDQLLGFVLVPLQTLYGKGRQTREYCLSSTDLFYTPAGTVHLSLAFFNHKSMDIASHMVSEGEGAFCLPYTDLPEVMMDCGQQSMATTNLCKVEFLDLEAASEGQHLVSMYYKLAAGASFEESKDSGSSVTHSAQTDSGENEYTTHGDACENNQNAQEEYVSVLEIGDTSVAAPLVHVRASSVGSVDDDMLSSPREGECEHIPAYFSGLAPPAIVCSMPISSKVTLPKEPSSSNSLRNQPWARLSAAVQSTCSPSPLEAQEKEKTSSTCQQVDQAAALADTLVEPETTINQEHFVDLYLKSMQQFTDKLADMKFSFDIDAKDLAALRSVQVDKKFAEARKKEGSKLYYGSRAFY